MKKNVWPTFVRLIASAGCFWAGILSAQTNIWTKSASGYWEEPFWSAGVLPRTNQDILFTNAWQALAIGQSTVQSNPASFKIGSLLVAAPPNSFSEILMNFAGLNNPLVIAGTNAWQSALVIRTNSGFVILNSALQVQNTTSPAKGAFTVGGVFNQGASSTVNAGFINVGLIGPGAYNLTNGLVQIGQEFVGSNYPSVFNQFAGTNTATILQLPFGGEYDLYGGVLTGTINFRGGAVNQRGGRYSGNPDFINGTYSLISGTFTSTALALPTHNLGLTSSAFPNFVQTGGTNFSGSADIWGQSIVGSGTDFGSYAISNGAFFDSGSLHVGPLAGFHQSGGISTNSGIGVDGTASGHDVQMGTFDLGGGVVSTLSVGISYAIYNQSGGTNQVAGNVSFASTEFQTDISTYTEAGNFSLSGGSLQASNMTANFGGAGTCSQSGGTLQLQQNLSLTGSTAPQPDVYGYVLSGGQLIAPNISVSNGVVFQHIGGTISSAGVLTLAGGTWITKTNQASLGKLMLTVSGNPGIWTNSTISFPVDGSILQFSNSSTMAWPSQTLLTIENWRGSPGGGGRHQIFFGNNSSGLTLQQLKQIQFHNPAGMIGSAPAVILSTGEIVPAPHTSPATFYVSGPSTNASPLRFKAIGAGHWHSLGVQSNGTVVEWGGDGFLRQFPVPSGLSGVIAVAGGGEHSLALKSDGTVVAWGDTEYSQSPAPSSLSNVVGIAAGEWHSLAVKSDGTVVGWGAGQPGSPADPNNFGQAIVPGYVTGVVAVAAGYAHNLALKSNSTVIAWGTNFYGETIVPAGLSNVVAIAAGSYHSLALKSDGTIVAWGDDRLGQTDVPSGLSYVVAISAGQYNSMALKSDGTVVTWGYPLNQNPVPDLSGVAAIAAGGNHDLALRSDGAVAAWGDDSFGQTEVTGSSITDHNIQDAINAAQDGDTILVGPGDYLVTNQITVRNAVRVQSTGGASQTFVTGPGAWCLVISNALAVVDGFTFQPASGPTGGALLAGATIQNCIFTNFDNASKSIVMSGGVVSNVIVWYLREPDGGSAAVYCTDSGLVTDSQILAIPRVNAGGIGIILTNSRLQNSVISGLPGGGNLSGACVSAVSSTVVGCTIRNNFSIGPAGAYLQNSLMDRCIVAGNIAADVDIGSGGGGIFETNSIIRNSLIVSNRAVEAAAEADAGGNGAGVYMQGGALLNCTVVGNYADEFSMSTGGGGGVFAESGGITNCIIFFNSLNVARPSTNWFNLGPAIFDHCCTTPAPGGAGNITQDPQFVNVANNNYHLAPSSPCIGTGVIQPWMIGAQDLDGNPRIRAHSVDMGAYEYRPLLSMRHAGANVVLSWPSGGSVGSILEQSSSLRTPQIWTTNPTSVGDDGTTKSVTIPATNNLLLYRLYLP
jgi:alpha-tubulin suppressor-like RCC1 family protein